jgi:hypothetical protein
MGAAAVRRVGSGVLQAIIIDSLRKDPVCDLSLNLNKDVAFKNYGSQHSQICYPNCYPNIKKG